MGLMDIRRRILADAPQLATATGAVASFQTDMAVPLKQCQFSIEPVQSGTGDPSPSNVRPISGWTGVAGHRTGTNVWDEEWEAGGISTSNGNNVPQERTRSKNYISLVVGQTYYLHNGSVSNIIFYWYDEDKTYVTYGSMGTSSQTFVAPYPYLRFVDPSRTTYNNNISINYPSTDTKYHPYTGEQIAVEFPTQGVNLFTTEGEITAAYIGSDGRIIAGSSASNGWIVSDFIEVEPSTQYTFQPNTTSGSAARHAFYASDDVASFISEMDSGQQTFTTPSNCHYVRFSYRDTSTDIQLEKGSTATAYEPYTNTVYGGTVDVTTGVLRVDRAKIVLNGTETWTSSGGLYTSVPTLAKLLDYSNAICADRLNTSVYQTSMTANSITGYKDTSGRYPGSNWIYAKVDGVTTVADITAWLEQNPVEVIYPLATPITYQLTPQQITALKGQNNVWHDANGNTTVQYWKH